jgi:peroxiredoxin
MKHFGSKFLISLPFTFGSVVLIILDQPLYAAIAGLMAFVFNLKEVKDYSTAYQFVNFRIHTLTLGYALDMLLGNGTYWYTAAMFCTSLCGLVRLEIFKTMAAYRFAWVEFIGLLGMLGFYLYANLQHPAQWPGWALPVFPIAFMAYIGSAIVTGKGKFKKEAEKNEKKNDSVIGALAPNFTLEDVDGNKVSLADFSNKNHVLLIFVRGDWCPTCHIMIRQYERNSQKFAEKNIIPIGISPDSSEVNKAMMERLGWKNMLLSDVEQEVASKYGILFIDNNAETKYAQGIALPASFLIDKTGVVRYMSRSDNAGEFLSPDLIFPVIESLA